MCPCHALTAAMQGREHACALATGLDMALVEVGAPLALPPVPPLAAHTSASPQAGRIAGPAVSDGGYAAASAGSGAANGAAPPSAAALEATDDVCSSLDGGTGQCQLGHVGKHLQSTVSDTRGNEQLQQWDPRGALTPEIEV